MPAFENDLTHSRHSDRSLADEFDQHHDLPVPPEDEATAGHLTIATGPNTPHAQG